MVAKHRFHWNTGTNLCGAGWKDRAKDIEFTIWNYTKDFEIKFHSSLNEHAKNESFGVNNLIIS